MRARSITMCLLVTAGCTLWGCAQGKVTVSGGGEGGATSTGGSTGGTTTSAGGSTGGATTSSTTTTTTTSTTTTTTSSTSTTTTTTTSGFCGDGVCAGSESCQSCPSDCECCGNGVCDANECSFCPQDCSNCCGNGVCDFLEDCASCVTDCGPGCCPTANPGNAAGPSIYLFTNYDGGAVHVDVNTNVPDMILGFVSYEAMDIQITGAFAGNVKAVHYAGYDNAPGTTVTGVPANLVTISVYPPATLMDPSGNPNIVCNYEGGCANQGGCNTAAQSKDYFVTQHAGKIASHTCQYEVFAGALSTSTIATCN